MAYPLKYTTLDAIANMLPQLFIEGVPQSGDEAYDSYGRKAVKLSLVLDVAWQEEAEITRIFSHLYEMPLKLVVDETKAIIAKIANHKIAAELKRRLFEQEPVPNLGATPGTGSGSNDAIANNLLQSYTIGHSIIIPGLGAPPQGFEPMQPIYLEGEVARSRPMDTINNRRITFGNYASGSGSSLSGGDNRAVGQESVLNTKQPFDIYD
jgi:hypothetical protein